jgi:nitrite reductase (NADH) small subunit/3-phenylpropionate/trans-cinnamate dioxygenase ferredoxin subunit
VVSTTDWIDVGGHADFREGRARAVRVGDAHAVVFRRRGRLFAMQEACPHMGASLAEGRIVGERVVCRWHGWGFDLESGACDHRSWARARIFEVREEGGRILVRKPVAPPPPPPPEADDWVVWDPDRHLRRTDDGSDASD